MSGSIIQTGIGLDQETIARCDRLRAAFGRSRSWVIERALNTGGLGHLEAEKGEQVQIFNALARSAGVTWPEYARRYVEAFGAKTYPPAVETLESIGFTGKETAGQLERKMTRHAGQERAARTAERESRQEEQVQEEASQLIKGLRDLR